MPLFYVPIYCKLPLCNQTIDKNPQMITKVKHKWARIPSNANSLCRNSNGFRSVVAPENQSCGDFSCVAEYDDYDIDNEHLEEIAWRKFDAELEGAEGDDIATPDDDAADDDIFRLHRFDMDLGDSSTVQGCQLLNVQWSSSGAMTPGPSTSSLEGVQGSSGCSSGNILGLVL